MIFELRLASPSSPEFIPQSGGSVPAPFLWFFDFVELVRLKPSSVLWTNKERTKNILEGQKNRSAVRRRARRRQMNIFTRVLSLYQTTVEATPCV